MNRPLVYTGAALVLFGIVLFFYVMFASGSPATDLSSMAAPADATGETDPSRGWGVLAGLAFAVGLAMIGIGMNRWRQPADRT